MKDGNEPQGTELAELVELNEKIMAWAKERGIDNPKTQLIKIMEEFGEVCRATNSCEFITTSDQDEKFIEEFQDAIGDTYVTIIVESRLLGIKPPAWINDASERYYDDAEWEALIFEEIGKLAKNISHDKEIFPTRDVMADILWELNELARNHGLSVEECAESAYNEIESRKGKTIDGNFIKD